MRRLFVDFRVDDSDRDIWDDVINSAKRMAVTVELILVIMAPAGGWVVHA